MVTRDVLARLGSERALTVGTADGILTGHVGRVDDEDLLLLDVGPRVPGAPTLAGPTWVKVADITWATGY